MTRTKSTFLALIAVLLSPMAANADFIYVFSFDQITFVGNTYAADGFSFQTPDLLTTIGQSAPVSPTGNLNGFDFSSIVVCSTVGGIPRAFCPGANAFGDPVGSVVDFFFSVIDPVAPGTYSTNLAGRGIQVSRGAISYRYTTGELTIREVPEPTTLILLGIGLFGMGLARRRKA